MLDYPYDSLESIYEEFEDHDTEVYDDEIIIDSESFSPPIGIAVSLVIVIFLLFALVSGGARTTWPAKGVEVELNGQGEVSSETNNFSSQTGDPYAFAAPYSDYVLTQGPHGQSYGQLAIDLAAGKGAAILSPIHGTVVEKYTDPYGNPTLVIENDVYSVKLLHGIYTVSVGDRVSIGQIIGEESNLGYTTDMRGVRCAGRTDYCGYHTHLNVYDKEKQQNINPLLLINP